MKKILISLLFLMTFFIVACENTSKTKTAKFENVTTQIIKSDNNVNVKDIVIAQGACTDSNFMHQFDLYGTFAPIADYSLLQTSVEIAKNKGIEPFVGNILSTDNFYNDGSDGHEK